MAFVVKIANERGDGAGRSRYLLKDPEKVLNVRTNALSPVALAPTPELYPELANDFNKNLLARQKDYRTDHFVISFQHRFTQEEIDEILDILEEEFTREFGEDRLFLAVVHAEEFSEKSLTPEGALEIALGEREEQKKIEGTAFHIVLGRNTEGKGIRLSKEEYMNFKRRVAERLQPYTNEREKEVFQHFLEGKRERDYYKKAEIYAPEKLEKVWARKIINDITKALQERDIEKAKQILSQHNAKLQPYSASTPSPLNRKPLKEDEIYILFPRFNGQGLFAMRLRKKARTLFQRYEIVLEEFRNEVKRVGKRTTTVREGIERAESIEERIRKASAVAENVATATTEVREYREQLRKRISELADEIGIDGAELERYTEQYRSDRNRAENIENTVTNAARQTARDRAESREYQFEENRDEDRGIEECFERHFERHSRNIQHDRESVLHSDSNGNCNVSNADLEADWTSVVRQRRKKRGKGFELEL
jgi:hypothetical protein